MSERLSLPVTAKTALAHIRLATVGNEDYDNCHPFTAVDDSGRSWTLIHNGTIFESDKLNRYVFRQKGETDSERILLYIVDQINEATAKAKRELSAEERFAILDGIISNSSPKNKLNLLIYDGELLYAHTNFKDSLYERKDDDGVTISTCPLTDCGWRPVPFTSLIAYRDGEHVFTGTDHHHEYIQYCAGRIMFARKEYEDAKMYLVKAVEQNPDVETQNTLALTYYELGEYEQAVNIFNNLLSKFPDNRKWQTPHQPS